MQEDTGDEEWLMVLATGAVPSSTSSEPLVLGIGTTSFPLLGVTVVSADTLEWGDRLYIGPGAWDQVVEIRHWPTYQQLPSTVQAVLAPTIASIIRRNERRFIEYFNTTLLDDLDSHPLSLLPGLGSDCRESIITARQQGRFADFDDLTTRVECLDQPRELLVERVLLELQASEETYHWLTE